MLIVREVRNILAELEFSAAKTGPAAVVATALQTSVAKVSLSVY